ncbi:hypothetical protein [Streptomyces sp. NRRL F-5053]|uniref:hypothetical protein n=1 Tax=Streptomyces sp. NRRL F-5053 TaxID=1463854 RepID=UPI0004C969BF|nr:hypothetical protein [Streptomyces sp. NRRL F-5053]
MIENPKYWLRDHAGKVLVAGTGILLAVSLFTLGGSLLGGSTGDTEVRADDLIVKLRKRSDTAETRLEVKHKKLLDKLPGIDTARAGRDEATGRSVLLSVVDFSTSSRNAKQAQVMLDTRYPFLGPTSRTLTEFVPQWIADEERSTTYALAQLDINISDVQGSNYSYVGMARLDPVTADKPNKKSTAKSEYVVVTYQTAQDGTVSSFEANRISSRSRNAWVTAEKEGAAPFGPTSPSPSSTRTGT